MWDGVFSFPPLAKHRDFEHNQNVAAHLRAQGIIPQVDRPVRVERNPINAEAYKQTRNFYVVLIEWDGKQYQYLVPSAQDGSPPGDSLIDKWINDYAHNPVPGGRRIEDYIVVDIDEL